VTLAHRGTLFLDELAEFDRDVLDALRQPLEEGEVAIVRAGGHVRYPARVQVVAAMNPCRCGFHGDPERPCTCPPGEAERYVRRVSGPLLDRLDLHVEMRRVRPVDLVSEACPEASDVVAGRIAGARARARTRNGGRLNRELTGREVTDAAALRPEARRLLSDMAEASGWSARGIHRVLRIARTIADLADEPVVEPPTVLAAAGLRDPRERAVAS
jgi:magnesium chelatase family protein